MLVCKHAVQKDARDKIKCTQTAGLCGHVYYCQLSCKWKQSRGAETCALISKTENTDPDKILEELKKPEEPQKPEQEDIKTTDNQKISKRGKAAKA